MFARGFWRPPQTIVARTERDFPVRRTVTAGEKTSPALGGTRFMEVGMQFIFQNTHEGLSDQEMMLRETDIVLLGEEVGMDFALLPEHHFDPGYSMMPDSMQWLSYL